MAQQTAVEWLADLLPYVTFLNYKKEIEQAKAIEKEQIIDAYQEGEYVYNNKITAEEYYNGTYNK